MGNTNTLHPLFVLDAGCEDKGGEVERECRVVHMGGESVHSVAGDCKSLVGPGLCVRGKWVVHVLARLDEDGEKDIYLEENPHTPPTRVHNSNAPLLDLTHATIHEHQAPLVEQRRSRA